METRVPLVSWAQANEDIWLLRALRDIRPGVDNAFYIDVGANDPETDSVTKLFYDCGWHGINVEPSPTWYQRLLEQRPRDINIQSAVSDRPGEITFYDDRTGGLGTLVEEIASSHRDNHQLSMEPLTVKAITLTEICEKYAPANIHFLKIDVEGAEGAVLSSMDFGRFRPWVLCVESHFPLRTDQQTHEEWDQFVLGSGYQFVFTDRINRYYLANERADRAINFTIPIDQFMYARDYRKFRELEDRVHDLERTLHEIRDAVHRHL
jgi:FkbM family methyltransferase